MSPSDPSSASTPDFGAISTEAWNEALDWAYGRKSWNNRMLEMEASPENRPQTLATIFQADAQEVVKWSALAVAAAQLEQIEAASR